MLAFGLEISYLCGYGYIHLVVSGKSIFWVGGKNHIFWFLGSIWLFGINFKLFVQGAFTDAMLRFVLSRNLFPPKIILKFVVSWGMGQNVKIQFSECIKRCSVARNDAFWRIERSLLCGVHKGWATSRMSGSKTP